MIANVPFFVRSDEEPGIKQPTLGFLSTWHFYEGTTIGPYSYNLLRGIKAAAAERGCNLLIACGVGPLAGARISHTAWPEQLDECDFVPVGPWNTDGLMVVPQSLTLAQTQYIQNLVASGFPVVFNSTDLHGPAVALDNAGGIRQAVNHLIQHGHRRIAFVAGKSDPTGDGAERLQAYIRQLEYAGIPYNASLVAFGDFSFIGGQEAIRTILSGGSPFSAVVASNDRSAIGAIKALHDAGLRVPEDVAVIGYDNILESKAHIPALTTIHNHSFIQGYWLVDFLLQRIKSGDSNMPVRRVPLDLIVRQSCGCQVSSKPNLDLQSFVDPKNVFPALTQKMIEVARIAIQSMTHEEIESICSHLAYAYQIGVETNDFIQYHKVINQLFSRLDTKAETEDILTWYAVISVLQSHLDDQSEKGGPFPGSHEARKALRNTQEQIIERSQFQSAGQLFQLNNISDRLTLMTAQLLGVKDESEIISILAEHMTNLQLKQVTLMLLEPQEQDLVSQSRVLLHVGNGQDLADFSFPSRQFPPPYLYHCPYQIALLPLVISEQLKGYVAFETDNLEPCGSVVRNLASAIHSLRLYREALEGRRLAEEANGLKSRFLSTVSHELRTPLNLIVGLSEILLRQKKTGYASLENAWQDIERIYTNAQHLGWLIGDVLDLASNEAGQLRLVIEPLDLSDVIHEVTSTGEQLARNKALSWEEHLPEKGPLVLGDRTRLKQVVLNLMTNAVKYTEQGKITLTLNVSENNAVFAVSDTGLGVPLQDQIGLFNEFYRSKPSINYGYSGIGLGLAISKQLIEMQGGTIGLYSSAVEGRGSTFFFTLPVVPARESVKREEIPAKLDKQQAIAYITERSEVPIILEQQLAELGKEIILFEIKHDPFWLPKLLVSSPAAVIMDDSFASQQGWEILQVLKQHIPMDQVPVLVFTYLPEQDKASLLELNYLRKPISTEQFSNLLYEQGLIDPVSEVSPTILLVDDDSEILSFNKRLIQSVIINCNILQAHNGREAMALVHDNAKPDLILLDLIMPGMDGFSILESLQGNERTRGIPVIVLTGKTLSEEDMARLNNGVTRILTKGLFNTQEIAKHIQSAFGSHRIPASTSQRIVRRTVAYIHANYKETLTRDQVAKYIGVNADHLTECFNREFGISPMTYLNRFRINRARRLLEIHDKKITEVAWEVGFVDSAHFSRMFHREVGVTPRDYQRGVRPDK